MHNIAKHRSHVCLEHGVSLHLPPRLPPPLLPVHRVQVAEHVGGGRGEDPLGVSLDRGVDNVARSVDTFGRNLKHAAMFHVYI